MLIPIIIFLLLIVISVPAVKRANVAVVLAVVFSALFAMPILNSVIPTDPTLWRTYLGYSLIPVAFFLGLHTSSQRISQSYRYFFRLYIWPVLIQTLVFTLLCITLLDWSILTSCVVALSLSLGSQLFIEQVLQLRIEHKEKFDGYIRNNLVLHTLLAFGFIAFLPLLQPHSHYSLQHGLGIFAILLILVSGGLLFSRYLVAPFFAFLSRHQSTELYLIVSALVSLCLSALADLFGLPLAVGAFLSGIVLSETAFADQLQRLIRPFKMPCVAAFFLCVGMLIDLQVVVENSVLILCGVLLFIVIKVITVFSFQSFKLKQYHWRDQLKMSVLLAHSGELALIILSIALLQGTLDLNTWTIVVSCIAILLMLQPLLSWSVQSVRSSKKVLADSNVAPAEGQIVLLGFGRVGQVVARLLHLHQQPFIAVDNTFEQLDFLKDYQGLYLHADLTEPSTLNAPFIAKARSIVVALDDVEDTLLITRFLRLHYPHIPLIVRTRDRHHAALSANLGVEYVCRETFYSSVELSKHLFKLLNIAPSSDMVNSFVEYDDQLILNTALVDSVESHIESQHNSEVDLQNLFENDRFVFQKNATAQNAQSGSFISKLMQPDHHP